MKYYILVEKENENFMLASSVCKTKKEAEELAQQNPKAKIKEMQDVELFNLYSTIMRNLSLRVNLLENPITVEKKKKKK